MNGSLIIVTGESGAGKSTIVEGAILRGHGTRVVTCTTRPKRANNGIMEQDGIDYHFFSQEEFTDKIANGEFAEHATVYQTDRRYGTLRKSIQETRKGSPIAFAIVDIQGAHTLQKVYPEAWCIFIHVERTHMEHRLRLRGESTQEIEERIKHFDVEYAQSDICDDFIVNQEGQPSRAINHFIGSVTMYQSIDNFVRQRLAQPAPT